MQHKLTTLARQLATVWIANIPFDKFEAAPLLFAYESSYLVKILFRAGGEIIQAGHNLIELQQSFQKVRPDKTCNAGDKPFPGFALKLGFDLLVTWHRCLVRWLQGRARYFVRADVAAQKRRRDIFCENLTSPFDGRGRMREESRTSTRA